jgi:hypothetical protein
VSISPLSTAICPFDKLGWARLPEPEPVPAHTYRIKPDTKQAVCLTLQVMNIAGTGQVLVYAYTTISIVCVPHAAVRIFLRGMLD